MTASHPLLDQPAPCSITLKNQRNESVNLEKYVGNKRPVVLFFYPRDEGPVCTKEVCAFRDSFDIFTKHGAILIGVSSSDVDSHSNFASKNRLQFDILADPRSELRKMYQVPKSGLGFVPGRATYVIDGEGFVRDYFNSLLNHKGHVENAIAILGTM